MDKKQIIAEYIKTKDFTKFCRDLKKCGIVSRLEIYRLFSLYSDRYLRAKNIDPWREVFDNLSTDLDKKAEISNDEYYNFLKQMTINKNSGRYKKILIEGGPDIYWASPVYGLADYNKSIWRKNTEENRRKMKIINNFLNK